MLVTYMVMRVTCSFCPPAACTTASTRASATSNCAAKLSAVLRPPGPVAVWPATNSRRPPAGATTPCAKPRGAPSSGGLTMVRRAGAPSLTAGLRVEGIRDRSSEDRGERVDDLSAFLGSRLGGEAEVRLRPSRLRERHVATAHRVDDRARIGRQWRHPVTPPPG